MKTYRAWTARQRQLVRDHYGPLAPRGHWPTREIAGAVGRSMKDVWAAARRWGLALREIVRPYPPTLMRLYNRRLSDGAIADRLGCSRETILKWRKRRGLPPVSGRGPGARLVHTEAVS